MSKTMFDPHLIHRRLLPFSQTIFGYKIINELSNSFELHYAILLYKYLLCTKRNGAKKSENLYYTWNFNVKFGYYGSYLYLCLLSTYMYTCIEFTFWKTNYAQSCNNISYMCNRSVTSAFKFAQLGCIDLTRLDSSQTKFIRSENEIVQFDRHCWCCISSDAVNWR